MRHLYPMVLQNCSSSLLLRNGWSIVMVGQSGELQRHFANKSRRTSCCSKIPKSIWLLFSVAAANFRVALGLLLSFRRFGLERLVLCPGSRSGALATAAGLLAKKGDLWLTTAIDERSAAFLALGMATASGKAVAVITSSGTAVANLLPAAVEADRSCQPLLLLTADRPLRLKNCGANQTVNQEEFLRSVCRGVHSGPLQGLHCAEVEDLDRLAANSWQRAHGSVTAAAGPVHLNLPFEEPLHASVAEQKDGLAALISGQADPVAIASANPPPINAAPLLDPSLPGVVVAGPWRGLASDLTSFQQAVRGWQQRSGWPLLADPLSALPVDLPGRLDHWELLLEALPIGESLQVLRLGPIPASRSLEQWLSGCSGPQLLITEGDPRPLDPLGLATQWHGGMQAWLAQQPEGSLGPSSVLKQLDQRLGTLLDAQIPCCGVATEPALARALARLLPESIPVMLAASSPVRDWMVWSGSGGYRHRCFSFRGASGIDGTLSLAMGLAMVQGRTVLITGDLALLHDSNGWLHGRDGAPPLLVVLIDNAGGGIFEQLSIESGTPEQFDRLFAMPQRVDPLALASAHGIPARQLACLEDLQDALEWGLMVEGPALLRVSTSRRRDVALRRHLRTAAQNELLTR